METMIQRIDFANETQKNKTDKIKEDLDEFVERTEDRLTEQDDNISTLQLSKENKNPFAFWLTNEGIMIAIIGGGVTIISILIEVFMK
jgi:peptidase E